MPINKMYYYNSIILKGLHLDQSDSINLALENAALKHPGEQSKGFPNLIIDEPLSPGDNECVCNTS